MTNAVIYARFSSAGQNEQTIDGQIRVCREYAEKQGLSVIGIYAADKAKSASKETEKRKDLHRMFADAETGAFQYIIVYKNKPFNNRTFESWLFNTKYTGEFYLGERLVTNVYPQIIDKLLFDKVQERLKSNRIFAGVNKAPVTYLLTGKAFCGHCGTAICADNGTARNGLSVHYYACKRKKKGKDLCVKKRNHKDNLEKAVTEFVVECLKDPVKVNKAAADTITLL